MNSDTVFRSLVVRENSNGGFSKKIETKRIKELPKGEVLIRTKYAGLNYKDALSASGHKGISKHFPHTPGVDACGVVEESNSTDFNIGDEVIVTGYDLGMNTSGGFQEYVRVPSNWVVPKPKSLTLKEAMIYGTAGFTAALSLYKMELMGLMPSRGSVLVTGATGGVGSMAVGVLAKAGYSVIASTGQTDASEYLKSLGASRIENRDFANDTTGKPLLRGQWAGAIDTVGGNTLATCIKACNRHGSVASCGLVASSDLHMTVYPFLLNGINVLGVDSAETEMPLRLELWNRLAGSWKINNIQSYGTLIPLEGLIEQMDNILTGKTRGRVVVDFSK